MLKATTRIIFTLVTRIAEYLCTTLSWEQVTKRLSQYYFITFIGIDGFLAFFSA